MIQLPLFPTVSSNFTYNIQLEEQVCIIKCVYNIRNGSFHIDFTDGNDNIVRGIKMVPGFPLLKYKKGFTDLNGDLMMRAVTEAAGDEITYDNFGTDYQLFYMTEDEIIAWEEEVGL